MKFSRRQALVASALVPTAPVWAKKRKSAILPPATDPFEEVTERLLALLPDTATYNGTPGSLAGGPLARRMDDYSPAGEAKIRAAYADAKKAVASMRRSGGYAEGGEKCGDLRCAWHGRASPRGRRRLEGTSECRRTFRRSAWRGAGAARSRYLLSQQMR